MRTLRTELHRLNWVKKSGIPSPLLNDNQSHKRLQWCRNHENYDWSNVVFTDESSVWLYPNCVKIWTKDDTIPLYQRPKHSPKFHMWGGISSLGTTPLCIFTENLTSERYISILETHLIPTVQVLYGNDWVLQQDNDPKHTAHRTKQWFTTENVTVLDWPSYSPDLNPIENVWGLIKDEINQKCLLNVDDMKREVVSYWDSMSHDFIQSFTDSMPRRIQECIQMEGGLTKY